MKDKDKKRYAQLLELEYVFLLPKWPEQVQKLQKKLRSCLELVDLSNPQHLETVDYYKVVILSSVLLYGTFNAQDTIDNIQNNPYAPTISILEFEAALRVVYDWCSAGGENAAKIGEPLD